MCTLELKMIMIYGLKIEKYIVKAILYCFHYVLVVYIDYPFKTVCAMTAVGLTWVEINF